MDKANFVELAVYLGLLYRFKGLVYIPLYDIIHKSRPSGLFNGIKYIQIDGLMPM